MTNDATLAAILGAAATSLSSTAPGSVTVPTTDQLTAAAQLLGRVNTLALAATDVQARAQHRARCRMTDRAAWRAGRPLGSTL